MRLKLKMALLLFLAVNINLFAQDTICKILYIDYKNMSSVDLVYQLEFESGHSFNLGIGFCKGDSFNLDSFYKYERFNQSYLIRGDSICYNYSGKEYSVFSPHKFRNKLNSFYFKEIEDSLMGNRLNITIIKPDSIYKIDGHSAFTYKTYYLKTFEIASFDEVVGKINKIGIQKFDPEYEETNTYFIPEYGLIFFSDKKIYHFKLLNNCEQNIFEVLNKSWLH